MKKPGDMGYSDSGSSGGYEKEKLDEGMAQSKAKNVKHCNEAAAANKKRGAPNHVGGPYAGT